MIFNDFTFGMPIIIFIILCILEFYIFILCIVTILKLIKFAYIKWKIYKFSDKIWLMTELFIYCITLLCIIVLFIATVLSINI